MRAEQSARLTDHQVRRLILAAVAGTPGGATEAWIGRVLDWATDVLIEHALLQAVLRGHLAVDASGEELAFLATARGERELDPRLLAAIRRGQEADASWDAYRERAEMWAQEARRGGVSEEEANHTDCDHDWAPMGFTLHEHCFSAG